MSAFFLTSRSQKVTGQAHHLTEAPSWTSKISFSAIAQAIAETGALIAVIVMLFAALWAIMLTPEEMLAITDAAVR